MTVDIESIDANFAPSVERMDLTYSINPPGVTASFAKLEIFSATNSQTPIFTDATIPTTGSNVFYYQDGQLGWDGGTDIGEYVSPLDSPLMVEITVSNDPAFAVTAMAVAQVQVEIHSLTLSIDNNPEHPTRFIVNSAPQALFQTACLVKIKDKSGNGVITKIPIRVDWSFEDPLGNNTPVDDSYVYDPNDLESRMGKAGDPDIVFWSSVTGSASGGDYKQTCFSMTVVDDSDVSFGKALINFLSSGVGGDDYKLQADVSVNQGQNQVSANSGTKTVWRRMDYRNRIFEMMDVTHVTANATEQKIWPFYISSNVLIEFKRDAQTPIVEKIPAKHSVQYVGLWKDAPGGTVPADFQKDWSQIQVKQN